MSDSAPTGDAGLRNSYDKEAALYDTKRYESTEGIFFTALELAVLRSWLPQASGTRMLDIPAGTGRMSVALAESGATIVGGDISANMLQVAAKKASAQGASTAHFVQLSGTQLPFADNTFDAVTSFKFFHLVPNERKPFFVQEMARVLRPGHRLVVEFNSPYYGLVLAFFRYYFRKKHPGGMRMKCIFPDQVEALFRGLRVTRKIGVKLPFATQLSAVLGHRAAESLNLWFGRIPGLRYLAYSIIIEAEKPPVSRGLSPGASAQSR